MDMGEILDGALTIFRVISAIHAAEHPGRVAPTIIVVYLKVRFNGDPTAMVNLFQDTRRGHSDALAVVIVWIVCALVLQPYPSDHLRFVPREGTDVGSALRLGGAKIFPLLLVASVRD